MALRPILHLPDPVLRKVSEPVTAITPELKALARDMLDTMYAAPGIGLAAVQVGVPKRLVVLDLGKTEDDRKPMVLFNPEVVWSSEERSTYEEGCLSIPDYYEEVERPARVRVRYRDESDTTHEIEADGLLSTCLQHEIDHLNGKLFLDHLSRLKRERVTKKFAKMAKRES
jgi:peptide deformylase